MRTLPIAVILASLFCIHFSMPLQAENPKNFQPGYIIVPGDTVKGLILVGDHFSGSKQCVFKATPDGIERKYSPDDLLAYGVDGKSFFYAAAIQNENSGTSKVFVSCLVKTNVSLFFYRNRFFVKDENGIEELLEVNTEIVRNGKTFNEKRPLYKSVLQQRMDDCSTIHEKLAGTKLTENSLVSLFRDYATCARHESMEFDSRNSQPSTIRYGFTVGLLAAELKLKSPSNSRYSFGENASSDRSFSLTPSFFVELGLSKKLDLCTGISWYFTKNHLRAVSPTTNLTHDFYLEASRLEVPVLLKYSLSSGPVKWSLKGGAGLNGLIKYEDRLVVTTTSSGYELNEYTNDLEENTLLMNWIGGVSAEVLFGNRSFLVEGYYSRTGSITDSGTDAWLEGFKLSVGIFL